MDEKESPQRARLPDLSSDAALDRLLRRLGPLLRWLEWEEGGVPDDRDAAVGDPDPAFERRLRAHLVREDTAPGQTDTPRPGRQGARWPMTLRLGLAAAALAVVILVVVAVVAVGVVTALGAALALAALAVVLVVRARLGN